MQTNFNLLPVGTVRVIDNQFAHTIWMIQNLIFRIIFFNINAILEPFNSWMRIATYMRLQI